MMTRAVLAAAGLPEAWRGRETFDILDVGFGVGLAWLATVAAWRRDASRCSRLRYAALVGMPPDRDVLHARLRALGHVDSDAAALVDRWPPPTRGVHRIELDGGRVGLWLAFGERRAMLPGWLARSDAVLVELAPDDAPETGLLRAAVATLVDGGRVGLALSVDRPSASAPCSNVSPAGAASATRSAGSALASTLAALSSAGMRCERSPVDRWSDPTRSAWRATRVHGRAAAVPAAPARAALVVGAGLAGGAIAHALARRAWTVESLDADAPMAAASGQPMLAQHPSVSPDDAPLSRLTRAATLLAGALDAGRGLRRLGRLQCMDTDTARAAAASLSSRWVRAVCVDEASSIAGLKLRRGGLWLPHACAASPAELAADWTHAGVSVRTGARVACLLRRDAQWEALDAHGRVLAHAPVAIVACGAASIDVRVERERAPFALHAAVDAAGLGRRAGTTTIADVDAARLPRCIVGGDGHAVPIDGRRLLLGPVDGPGGARLERAWARWSAQLAEPSRAASLRAGPDGERLSTRDHLPLIGPVPEVVANARRAPSTRHDDTTRPPAAPDLWIATAFGGRGLLWSVLAAELLAARLEHEPLPVEDALARHLAPDRFALRARRRDPARARPPG